MFTQYRVGITKKESVDVPEAWMWVILYTKEKALYRYNYYLSRMDQDNVDNLSQLILLEDVINFGFSPPLASSQCLYYDKYDTSKVIQYNKMEIATPQFTVDDVYKAMTQ